MTVLPKFSPRFKTTLIKIPTGIFVETDKLILRFIWKSKEFRIAKAILTKNIVGGLIHSVCKYVKELKLSYTDDRSIKWYNNLVVS